jgi:hypothetical protein
MLVVANDRFMMRFKQFKRRRRGVGHAQSQLSVEMYQHARKIFFCEIAHMKILISRVGILRGYLISVNFNYDRKSNKEKNFRL